MSVVDLIMPKMGESIMEATILNWLKKPGDKVEVDEAILEIATDKVDSEVPAVVSGYITEILFNVNDVVPIGAVIAKISTESVATETPTIPLVASTSIVSVAENSPSETENTIQQNIQETTQQAAAERASITEDTVFVQTKGSDKFFSPLVLNIAKREGISMAELDTIAGTGQNGRVSKKDILEHLKNRGHSTTEKITETLQSPETTTNQNSISTQTPVSSEATTVTTVPSTPSSQPKSTTPSGNVEIIEMDRMRKLIANHMVMSKQTSPHVTSFMEADVTQIVNWRNRVKSNFEKKHNDKITFTPIFIEAIAKCILNYPLINSSINGENIIVKKDINIGMATALPSGNLIVPVIRNADYKNLVGLSKEVNALAQAARNNKLKPDDTQGGTFTLTNVGTFGSLMGTPIINQPQVAILAVGAIKKRPMVLETPEGDVIAIRHMMYLSMSYDHRIVDGSIGAAFLTAVAKELEAFDDKREI